MTKAREIAELGQKLTVDGSGNLDIAGSGTFDGLTVDGAGAISDLNNGAVSSLLSLHNEGTSSGTMAELKLAGGNGLSTRYAYIRAFNGGSSNGNAHALFFGTNPASGAPKNRMAIGSTGDVSFYDDLGSQVKFFWDSGAESLTLGASAEPSVAAGELNLVGGSTTNNTAQASLSFFDGGSNDLGTIKSYRGSSFSDGALAFEVAQGGAAPVEAMRIDSSGRVGIGTSTPAYELSIEGLDTVQANLRHTDTSSYGMINFSEDTEIEKFLIGYGSTHPSQANELTLKNVVGDITAYTGGTERMRITSSGDILAKTIDARIGSDVGAVEYGTSTANSVRFYTNDTEAARFDGSGNFLVGTTSSPVTLATTGSVEGFGIDANDYAVISRASGQPLILNRLTDDGSILSLRRNGAVVGNIGAAGTDTYIGTGDTGLLFQDNDNAIYPIDTGTQVGRDAAVNLGKSDRRFKDFYLSGGVYLGGTGSANKFDDYEIGAASGLSISGAYGNAPSSGWTLVDSDYVKVGRTVTVRARFINTSTTNVSVDDRAVIAGLPFTADSLGTVASAGTCFIYGQISSGHNAIGITAISVSTTDAFFYITHLDGSVQYNDPLTVIITYKTT